MSKKWNIVGVLLGAAAGLGAAHLHNELLRRPLAKTQGELQLPGLSEAVEVFRDRWGVPHIYAQNSQDLMFAQGFVQAQDRLWQMDFQRRVVSGRLTEILGERALPLDRWMRILGMRRVCEQEVALIAPHILTDLKAFVTGVNARIALGRLPLEFRLLRYQPEPWTLVDSLCWVKMISWSLSVNWEGELLRAKLIDHLGPERAAELDVNYPAHKPLIVPQGVELSAIGDAALARAEAARPFIGPPAQAGLGSNNWVLAGSRTATGMPLLANDMHLTMNAPCIWYENHLVGGDLDVTGVTFPGVPGVISGHNGRVAWGFTNGFPDVQDLYVERLRRTEDGGVQYEYKGEWLDAQVVRKDIHIRGGKTQLEEVIVTHHGPIINALAPDFAGEQPLALRWTLLEPDTMIHAIYNMNRAQDCLAFRDALRDWTGPVQNTVYADTQGNIAYSFPGKLPIRAKGEGQTPVPGWTGEYEWLGYVPFEELPHFYNPPQGYVATANNRVVGKDYAHFIGRDQNMGDRAKRIDELIQARAKIDSAYIGKMQLDLVSPTARVIADYIGRLPVDDPKLAAVVELLRQWDGQLRADSPAAAVQQVFTRKMLHLTLADKLGDLTRRYMGKGPTPTLADGSIFGTRSWAWLQKEMTKPNSPWFDLGQGESRDDVMRLALAGTVEFLRAELGPEISDWAWGKLHTLTHAHVLGSVKLLGRLFNRGPYPLGGDGSTVCATGASRYNLDSERIIGAPFRFIADLGDLRNSLGLLTPGQSGQPGSPHYDDQVTAWFEGEYHQMLYAREDVERESTALLRLSPA